MEHLDWEQVDADGNPLTTLDRWHDVCFNSSYFRKLMLGQIKEMFENYK